MKEYTNSSGNVTSFAVNVIFFFLAGNYTQGHDLKGLGKFCENINAPDFFKEKAAIGMKEWREVTFM